VPLHDNIIPILQNEREKRKQMQINPKNKEDILRQVNIQEPDGTIFSLDVVEIETIEDLKTDIELMTGINVNDQTLTYNNNIIKD